MQSFTNPKKPVRIQMSSAGTQDNMRPFSHALPRKGTDVPALERSRKWLFCVPVPIADDETMHHVTVAIEKSDALTDKPARELARGISGTKQNGDVTASPTIRGALEIEPRPYGSGSLKGWPKSGISPAWLVLLSNEQRKENG